MEKQRKEEKEMQTEHGETEKGRKRKQKRRNNKKEATLLTFLFSNLVFAQNIFLKIRGILL